jgi:hypothetical protein
VDSDNFLSHLEFSKVYKTTNQVELSLADFLLVHSTMSTFQSNSDKSSTCSTTQSGEPAEQPALTVDMFINLYLSTYLENKEKVEEDTSTSLKYQIAKTPPGYPVGEAWSGEYENCTIAGETDTTYDVHIASDGALCSGILKMYVRSISSTNSVGDEELWNDLQALGYEAVYNTPDKGKDGKSKSRRKSKSKEVKEVEETTATTVRHQPTGLKLSRYIDNAGILCYVTAKENESSKSVAKKMQIPGGAKRLVEANRAWLDGITQTSKFSQGTLLRMPVTGQTYTLPSTLDESKEKKKNKKGNKKGKNPASASASASASAEVVVEDEKARVKRLKYEKWLLTSNKAFLNKTKRE